MGCLMYYKDDSDQLGIDEFFLPFGGKLKKDNRWVKAAEIMPWSYIEEVYLRSMNQEIGRAAFPARIAYGAIYVKRQEQLTDEETVTAIAENPYIQYFLGLKEFRDEPLFDASMMVHFRKRLRHLRKNMQTVLDFVDGFLEEMSASMKVQMQIDVAVEELFVNIAHYAYTPETGI